MSCRSAHLNFPTSGHGETVSYLNLPPYLGQRERFGRGRAARPGHQQPDHRSASIRFARSGIDPLGVGNLRTTSATVGSMSRRRSLDLFSRASFAQLKGLLAGASYGSHHHYILNSAGVSGNASELSPDLALPAGSRQHATSWPPAPARRPVGTPHST